MAALLVLSVLAGCASSLSAQVTRYQQWPGDTVGAMYRIDASDAQKGNLQFSAYSDMVRAAIGATGMVEARGSAPPRFDISLEYGNPVSQVWVQRNPDPFYGGGYYGFNRRPFGWGYSPWYGWPYGPVPEQVQIDVFKNYLTVVIRDRTQDHREVYRATARNTSRGDNLTAVMPYLARAVFDHFPGRNGQVVDVKYDLPR
ncbi:MAG: DUF4136 domain-containing protein [Alcaligenaceae bacterium]|nr:DUF4136 domain-containing protein [Alcaligenaceae bacterium]